MILVSMIMSKTNTFISHTLKLVCKSCLYISESSKICVTGIGMDASVTPLRHGGLSLVQTTDFFYPLVDDPYMQGKSHV